MTGLEAVQAQISFQVSAPTTLAGMQRDQVRLISSSEEAGALITYGKGLGGLAVLELPASEGGEGGSEGPRLPGVSIPGTTHAQQLETPLGTLVRFRLGDVEYAVVGSVTPAVAQEAAQGL